MRIVVNDWEAALLFRNGRYVEALAPGAHRFWGLFQDIAVKRVLLRQWVSVANIDVVSADRFPLRLSVSALCRVNQPKVAHDEDHLVRAQRVLNAAIAQAAADVALDALVVGRDAVAAAAGELAADAVPGCRIEAVQLMAVVLPPEVRRLFTEVERARREGQAALERARAEHAALRALANAARLLRGNPELMNLRLLQAVGTGQKPGTLVLGGTALAPISAAGPLPPEADADPVEAR